MPAISFVDSDGSCRSMWQFWLKVQYKNNCRDPRDNVGNSYSVLVVSVFYTYNTIPLYTIERCDRVGVVGKRQTEGEKKTILEKLRSKRRV